MRRVDLNLASRPFVNLRPIKRTAVLLWLVGSALLVVNGLLYWRHFSGRGEQTDLLDGIEGRIEQERSELARLQSELTAIDLDWQNRQVAMLNAKIDNRTFSWSALFDRLAEVMPRDIQLRRVTPRIRQDRERGGGAGVDYTSRSATVDLDLDGSARNGEVLLEFVDALFAHPSFHQPDLVREARQSGESTDFAVTVSYLQDRRTVESRQKTSEAEGESADQPAAGSAAGAAALPAGRAETSGRIEAGGAG